MLRIKKIILLGFLLSLLFCPGLAGAVLLDKIAGAFNDKVITLSQIKRMKQTMVARANISPRVFSRSNYSLQELVQLCVNRFLIREKLSQIGYVIGDEQVEGQIKSVEKKSGLSRKDLLGFLKENDLSFDEYFELIRETIEYDSFTSRIIAPLISITDQDVKNAFYKKNLKNKTLTFKYSLTDFSIEKRLVTKDMLKKFKQVLINYQSNGNLPQNFSKMETNILGDLSEDNLTKQLKNLLKKTPEGSFSSPILLGDDYHVFFIQKKDLVESEIFLKAKDRIRGELIQKSEKKIIADWIKREKNKHYVKIFI